MTRARIVVLALAAAAVLAGLGSWLAPRLERVEIETVDNISERARRNPFLALERFLGRLGHEVETGHRAELLDRALAPGDTVIVAFSDEVFTTARSRRLLAWIEAGGHLVLELDGERWADGEPPANLLLDRIGVWAERLAGPDGPPPLRAHRLQAGHESFAVELALRDALLDDSASAEAWTVDGHPQVLRYRHGHGRLTVLTTRAPWRNDAIGKAEHAALLAALLGRPHGRVWVLYRVQATSLAELLWRHGTPALIALAVALGLALWALYDRFGPLEHGSAMRRRSLGEHVQALAAFGWRHGRAAGLLHAARAALRQRAESRHPGFQRRSPDGQVAWLAERIGREPAEVRRALEAEARRPEQLIGMVRLLQQMRNSL